MTPKTYFDPDDRIWVAWHPDTPGCMAHGVTAEKAEAEWQVALQLRISLTPQPKP